MDAGHTMPPITSKDSLYSRLGGYDAIAAVADDLLPRLRNDPRLHTPANEGQTNRSVWEPNSNTHPDWLAERRGFELSVRERTDDDGFLKPRARDGFFNQNLRKSA